MSFGGLSGAESLFKLANLRICKKHVTEIINAQRVQAQSWRSHSSAVGAVLGHDMPLQVSVIGSFLTAWLWLYFL